MSNRWTKLTRRAWCSHCRADSPRGASSAVPGGGHRCADCSTRPNRAQRWRPAPRSRSPHCTSWCTRWSDCWSCCANRRPIWRRAASRTCPTNSAFALSVRFRRPGPASLPARYPSTHSVRDRGKKWCCSHSLVLHLSHLCTLCGLRCWTLSRLEIIALFTNVSLNGWTTALCLASVTLSLSLERSRKEGKLKNYHPKTNGPFLTFLHLTVRAVAFHFHLVRHLAPLAA